MSSTACLRPSWMLLGVDQAPDGVTIWFSDTPIDTEVRSANEMLRAGRDIAAERLAWDAAFLLTRARQS